MLRLAVVGAGVIGRKHIELIKANALTALVAIVDPSAHAATLADAHATRWFADIESMFDATRPDGVILATPNGLHASGALAAIRRGIPVLIEKPIAASMDDASLIARASETEGVPILVGHHRRHNPIIRAARDCVKSGRLGRLTAIAGMTLFYKPDEYYEPEWRRSSEAGPVLINLVHGIDDLRFICGEIESVQAMTSHSVRNYDTEDTAAVIMRFENGALGTFTLSDTTVAPWSWELTSGENPDYPRSNVGCYLIGGTEGSMSLPDLRLWSHSGKKGWNNELTVDSIDIVASDSLAEQLAHFTRMVRKVEKPICDARDAMKTLATIDAIHRAARLCCTVRP